MDLRSRVLYALLCLLGTAMLLQTAMPALTAPENEPALFPVSDFSKLSFTNTGKNHYYGMRKKPDEKQILTVGGGFQDLLLYDDGRFRVQVLPQRVYSYGVDWHPEAKNALIVGSRLPPSGAGTIWKYTAIDTGAKLLKTVSENLTGVDYNEKGEALIVGGTLAPEPGNLVLMYKNNTFEQLETPDTTPLRKVAWHPNSSEALMVGLEGMILHYDGKTIEPIDSETSDALFTVAWSPDGSQALIGGENGRLYRWNNNYLMEITTGHPWNIRDIDWHPSGEKALVVGGTREGGSGYWGIYRSLKLTSNEVSKPLFSVEWMDSDNALIGGQKVLWRYSTNTQPESIGMKPSISVKRRTARTGKTFLVSGFGSTVSGSVHNVKKYQFKIDQEPPANWQSKPAMQATLREPGQHTVSLRVKAQNGKVSDWTHYSMQLLPGEGQRTGLIYWSWVEILLMVLVLLGALSVLYWLFRDEIKGTS